MTSEIDKLKHFHVENYSGTNFTDDLNDGEEFFILQLELKMKKSKRYIKKQNNKSLINKKVLDKVMRRRFYGFNNRFRNTKNTEAIIFENGGFVGNLGLAKKLWKKYTEAIYKYRTNTDKMTASDYTHLFGYLNPYYRSAYSVSKRRK